MLMVAAVLEGSVTAGPASLYLSPDTVPNPYDLHIHRGRIGNTVESHSGKVTRSFYTLYPREILQAESRGYVIRVRRKA
jgi:hypothetical protein